MKVHKASGFSKFVLASFLRTEIISGKKAASLKKKTGKCRQVISKIPSPVQNFTANPLPSLTLSGDPLEGPEDENLTKVLVYYPTLVNKSFLVQAAALSVNVKIPFDKGV